MFNEQDAARDAYMLTGPLAKKGYDWWWHSFTGVNPATGEEQPFFIEYFAINPELAEDEPVFGQLPANKEAGKMPSYLMVKAGAWGKNKCQLHRFFSLKDVSISKGASFSVRAADCYVSEEMLKGSVYVNPEEAMVHPEWMSDAGSMEWNLTVDKQIAFNVGYGASDAFREMNAFEMYWHAQGMKTQYTGTVVLNGIAYDVRPETSYGYADKNWGSDFTSPWVWLSSNHLISNVTGEQLHNSVFDIGGGRPVVAGVPLDRKLLSAVYVEGEEFEFNFSKLWTNCHTTFNAEETETHIIWDVIQETDTAAMDAHFECAKADMLLVNYESPDGEKRHQRLWNGGNGKGTIKVYRRTGKDMLELVEDMTALNVGCEYGEY